MILKISLFNLVNEMPTESWCSCEDFTLHRCKPEDWNLYNDAAITGKHLQIFRRINVTF